MVSTPNASFLMASQPWGRPTDAITPQRPLSTFVSGGEYLRLPQARNMCPTSP